MVQTDMGNFGARSFGLEAAPVTLEESVTAILANVSHSHHGEKTGLLLTLLCRSTVPREPRLAELFNHMTMTDLLGEGKLTRKCCRVILVKRNLVDG